jgi:hypothetical protein
MIATHGAHPTQWNGLGPNKHPILHKQDKAHVDEERNEDEVCCNADDSEEKKKRETPSVSTPCCIKEKDQA